MILLKAIKIKFLNNAIHKVYEGPNNAFTILGTFIYNTTYSCEAALLLFTNSTIDDIEENIRT